MATITEKKRSLKVNPSEFTFHYRVTSTPREVKPRMSDNAPAMRVSYFLAKYWWVGAVVGSVAVCVHKFLL